MKTILTTALVAAAALSLGACSKPEGDANLSTTAEPAFNESDIPAEGNLGGAEDYANSSAALDNLAGENLSAPTTNETAPAAGNAL